EKYSYSETRVSEAGVAQIVSRLDSLMFGDQLKGRN
ncbi:MAG: hypothetical protein H6Q55_228, partial [Deltaproteobacteria bacterium]|nr:hypothetical protein [Deltaproteobacteria bacterium]